MANVFNLDRTFKVVGTDGRIRGEWVIVLPPSGRAGTAWISPPKNAMHNYSVHEGIKHV